jgi:hypothetical protein
MIAKFTMVFLKSSQLADCYKTDERIECKD